MKSANFDKSSSQNIEIMPIKPRPQLSIRSSGPEQL